jgi:hypothetical protein
MMLLIIKSPSLRDRHLIGRSSNYASWLQSAEDVNFEYGRLLETALGTLQFGSLRVKKGCG